MNENLSLQEEVTGFLGQIGIPYSFTSIGEDTRLPGLRISSGRILIDSDKISWAGDLLYLGGLLAVSPLSERTRLTTKGKPDPGDELPAMAWAYAAAKFLGIDPLLIFHEGGYQSNGRDIVEQFEGPRPFGVPLLEWLGLCEKNQFPKMNSWLREIEPQSTIS